MTFQGVRFPPSNTYIQWAAETGIIGLLILAYLFYSVVVSIKNLPNCDHKFLVKFGFGGALLAFVIGISAVPDQLYLGGINFVLAMYIAGIKIFVNNYKFFAIANNNINTG